jgi:uncharacterized protein with GYD domain
MPTFIMLVDWTGEGVKKFRETIDRAGAAAEIGEKLGCRMTNTWWTLGAHDLVVTLDAPDDETATAFALAVCSRGNIRTHTMRAFDRNEIAGVIDRVPS